LKTKVISFLLLTLLIIVFQSRYHKESQAFKLFLKSQTESIGREQESVLVSSFKKRNRLLKDAFEISYQTCFLGVGSGNFETEMSHWRTEYAGEILDAHNFIMELLATNGLLIMLGFLIILFRWAVLLAKLIRKTRGKMYYLNWAALFSLLLFIPASSLPSSIMRYFFYWVIFAFIHSLIEVQSASSATFSQRVHFV
jgi:teichuronic acid biosynthesis protein TuaE